MKEEVKGNSANQFSNSTKEIISYSRDEALRLGNDFIGTEHLFLGILKHNDNTGVEILKHSIDKLDQLRSEIENSIRNELVNEGKVNTLPLTKQGEKVIRVSVLEAKSHNTSIVDSGCLLLSILRAKDAATCQIIEKYGLDHPKASSLYFQIQKAEKIPNDSYAPDPVQKIPQSAEADSQVQQLLERIIHVSMKNSIDGVLDIENESAEIAALLTSLGLDQGMMFGLFGQWGRGKTFFWKNIWDNLSKHINTPFYKVEFHAWKYQDTPATWAYLYEVLAKEFYRRPTRNLSFNWIGYYFRIFWLNLNRKGLTPILKFLLILGIGSIIFLTVKEIGKEQNEAARFIANYVGLPASIILIIYSLLSFVKKEYSSSAKDVFIKYSEKYSTRQHLGIQAEIQKELSILLKVWIPKKKVGKKRVLIFIDDIDRCNETKIIQIIDSLRIMLDEQDIAKRCVVLAAIDERILKIAISTKYYELVEKDFDGDGEKKISLENLVREYMDKLFIGGVKLRTLNHIERQEILGSLTKGKIHSVNEEKEAKKATAINIGDERQKQIKSKSSVKSIAREKAVVEPNDELFELEDFEYQYLKDVLEKCGPITPRVIRIFYYRYLLAKRFLFLKTSQDHELYKKWNDPKVDKAILPYLIMFFTVNVSPDEINNSYFLWSNNSSQEANLGDFQFEVLNKSFHIDGALLREILEVIEIIVPY